MKLFLILVVIFSLCSHSVYGTNEDNSYTGITAGTFAAKYKDVIPKDGKLVHILVKVKGMPQSQESDERAKEIRFLQANVLKFVTFAGGLNTKSSILDNEFSTYVHPKVAELLEQHPNVISILILDTLSSGQIENENQNLVCKNNYQLIFKKHGNTPACVTLPTAKKLIQIGWARVSTDPNYENKIEVIFNSTINDSIEDINNSSNHEKTTLRLIPLRYHRFNEGQPIVFDGKLTSQSGKEISNATIIIKSDGPCPANHIIANGITDPHGKFWILTPTKIWDESDNMIKAHAEFNGSEKFSPSVSDIQIVVVYPIMGEKCNN
jgi:hypothetical protein